MSAFSLIIDASSSGITSGSVFPMNGMIIHAVVPSKACVPVIP